METTADQRRAFGEAAENLLSARGLQLGDAAAELNLSYEALRQYLRGQREPTRRIVFNLEQMLGAEPGQLSRILGYLPADGDPRPMSVVEAVEADPRLNKRTRNAILLAYKALVGEA